MDEEMLPDHSPAPQEVVTITTAVTPVIVKAVSTNLPDAKILQRSISESVLVIAPNPQVKAKLPMQQTQITQPVIVKNTNSIIVQNYNRNISSSQTVIRSTKTEELKLSNWSTNGSKTDGDLSNDSCSLFIASDNSMDSVLTPFGSTQSNEKTDIWIESTSRIIYDNEDSRDSKTEDSSSNTPTNQKDTSRDARNKAEKQRRDKLNSSINELSTLVPLVTESSRKIDKTGVLRLTAHELRKEYVFGNSIGESDKIFKPHFINAFIDMMDGCLFTATCKGIIIVISPNIERYLGHCQTDLLGTNIMNLCHPDDVEILKANLMPHETPLGIRAQLLPNNLSDEDFTKMEKQRQFYVRLARVVPRSEPQAYETCKIIGHLRRADKANTMINPPKRRQRQRNEETGTLSGNDVVFIGLIQMIKKEKVFQKLFDASKEEYKTRHLTDGRIICCDHRIAVVAGYMTSEVNGVSAFTFMHKDDVRWVIVALRQMYDRNKSHGESCYRLITKTGDFIYMRTAGFLEVGAYNNVKSFICINTRLSEEEGKRLINEMKNKYKAIFDSIDNYSSTENNDDLSIEDPLKLEQAIIHLISNLTPSNESNSMNNSATSVFSIIAPQIASVKPTIEKSLKVIGKAAEYVKNKEKHAQSHKLPSPNSSPVETIDSLSSNAYLADVIDKMDLFDDKKNNLLESPPIYNESLHNDSLNKPSASPNVCHCFPINTELQKIDINGFHNTDANITDVSQPSTSKAALSVSQFVVESDKVSSNLTKGLDSRSIPQPINIGDPLIGSNMVCQDFNKMTKCGQKRSLSENGDFPLTISKRLTTVSVNNSEMPHLCDPIFPIYTDTVCVLRNNDNGEGFEHFIDELTDPNSDLGIVVPRSLVALETSLTGLDDTVTQINPIYTEEGEGFNEIIDTHSENKNILETIMSEHRTSEDVEANKRNSEDKPE